MADFYGCLESTSFRVKDAEAFKADPDIQQLIAEASGEGFFNEEAGYFSFGWYGQYPSPILQTWNEDADEEKETDLLAAIQRHIHDEDVCRVSVSGNEKLRYIGGGIWFVSAKGVAFFDGTTEWGEKLTRRDLQQLAADFSKRAEAAA